jgi:hypothetical protein
MDAEATTHRRLYRARLARAVAGGTLILTAAAMIAASIAVQAGPAVMVAGWLLSGALLLAGRYWPTPRSDIAQASARLSPWSLRLPLIGLSLLTPLTLHGIIALLIGVSNMREFSQWIVISAVVVGQAHLTLAWLASRDAGRMTGHLYPTDWKPMAWSALWKTSLAACIPSVVLLAVPPLLTFITGAAFVPVMYWAALRVTAWERACEEWLVLAERTGLDADVLPDPSLPSLTGTIDGIPVSLSGWRLLTGDMMFELEVGLAGAELMHLRISADPTQPAQLRTGEPVADAVLRISSSGNTDLSALTDRIRDPDCYAALMEVVHGQGATISQGRIRLLTSATSLTPIWEALPQLIDLARLLRSPSSRTVSASVSQPRPVRLASPAG